MTYEGVRKDEKLDGFWVGGCVYEELRGFFGWLGVWISM